MSSGTEKALNLLRRLPRLNLSNLKANPGSNKSTKRGHGIHGGKTHGAGAGGSGQRQNFMRAGYETGNNPFYQRFPNRNYYKGHHFQISYVPLSLQQLQLLIDTDRLPTNAPIDISQLMMKTGLFKISPLEKEGGFHMTEDGFDIFSACINLEVQRASETVIAAIERNGGVITTSYYDPISLAAVINPFRFFTRGVPIPRRKLPAMKDIDYYSDPKNRGYLADPEEVAKEKIVLAQKYGYNLPSLAENPMSETLAERKDPRQIFHGLEPGWIVNLPDQTILKPKGKELQEFYQS